MVPARGFSNALTRTPEVVLLPTALAGSAPLRWSADAATPSSPSSALIWPSDDPSNTANLTESDLKNILGAGQNLAILPVGKVLVPASLRAKLGAWSSTLQGLQQHSRVDCTPFKHTAVVCMLQQRLYAGRWGQVRRYTDCPGSVALVDKIICVSPVWQCSTLSYWGCPSA
jgi:hypothetical protein